MCGIAGCVNWSGEPADRRTLQRMIGAIRHRGPDDEGVFVDGAIGLAHARLSILDLAGGHQPERVRPGRASGVPRRPAAGTRESVGRG